MFILSSTQYGRTQTPPREVTFGVQLSSVDKREGGTIEFSEQGRGAPKASDKGYLR